MGPECPKGNHGVMAAVNSLHNPSASEYFCKICGYAEKMPEDIVAQMNQTERMMRAQQGPRPQ